MSLPNYFLTALAQTLSVGGNDTSIEFSTIFTQDGQVITTADFAQYGRGIITINPLSLASVEFASFTAVNPALGATGGVTGVLRGLSFKGNTQIPANQKFNVIGTPVIISFGVHNLLDIPALVGDNTFLGLNTFSQFPITPSSAPTTNYQVANKKYVDDAVIVGGTPATTTNLGLVKMDVAPTSAPSPIAVGSNSPLVVPTGTSGGIIGFTSTTARTSSVLLTAHALIVGGGADATPTPLASLGTSTTVLHGAVAGDPTFRAVSLTADVSGILPVANGGTGGTSGVVVLSTNGTANVPNSSTTQTITHGLGKTPTTIRIHGIGQQNGTGNASISNGIYSNASQSSIYIAGPTASPNNPVKSSVFAVYVDSNGSGTIGSSTGVIGNITSTTFDIVWTMGATLSSSTVILWEAQ